MAIAAKELKPNGIRGDLNPSLIRALIKFAEKERQVSDTSHPLKTSSELSESCRYVPFADEPTFAIATVIVDLNLRLPEKAKSLGIDLSTEDLTELCKLGEEFAKQRKGIVSKASDSKVYVARSITHLLENLDSLQPIMREIDIRNGFPTFRGKVLKILGKMACPQLQNFQSVIAAEPLPIGIPKP